MSQTTGSGRAWHRRPGQGGAEILLVNPTDDFLYLPLLPEVAIGILEPRRICVSLAGTLSGVRLVLGEVSHLDLKRRRVRITDPEAGPVSCTTTDWSWVGGVNKLLPIPAVADHARGLRGIPEVLYLRDHVTGRSRWPWRRSIRLSGRSVPPSSWSEPVTRERRPRPTECCSPTRSRIRITCRVLPGLHARMSRAAERVLLGRRVDVRTGVSVKEVTAEGVQLTDGECVSTRSLI